MILVEKCELQGMLPSIDFLNIASASRCQYKRLHSSTLGCNLAKEHQWQNWIQRTASSKFIIFALFSNRKAFKIQLNYCTKQLLVSVTSVERWQCHCPKVSLKAQSIAVGQCLATGKKQLKYRSALPTATLLRYKRCSCIHSRGS